MMGADHVRSHHAYMWTEKKNDSIIETDVFLISGGK